MKLAHIIGTLDPRYGGPVEVLSQLNTALVKDGHDSDTIVLDDDSGPGVDVFPGSVRPVGKSLGRYRYNRVVLSWLREHAVKYDAVVVHGIWQYQSFAVWRAARGHRFPYFVFVHGALDPWFQRTYPLKHLKKRLYWTLVERRVLHEASGVIFTCQEERRLANRSFPSLSRARAIISPIGISKALGDPVLQREALLSRYPHLRDKRILLFVSRIDRKKGLNLLIEAFSQVASKDARLHLLVVGPDEQGLGESLRSLAHERSVVDRITWTGMLVDDLKWGAFGIAEAFVLPSHSENFGVVLVEALSQGVPVLTTDKVNIWREIEAAGAGFVETDTVDGVRRMLTRWLELPHPERRSMAQRAAACFSTHFDLAVAADKFIRNVQRNLALARVPAPPATAT